MKLNKLKYEKRELFPLLALGSIMCLSAIIKYLILSNYVAPFPDDGGNYIREAKIWLGVDLWNTGPEFPPLSILPISLLLLFFDAFTTLKIIAITYSTFIAIPFYFLAEEITHSKIASIIATSLMIFYPLYINMIAWANYAAYLGFSFICLSIYFLVKTFAYPSKANILCSALSISLIAGSDVLPFYYFVIGMLSFLIATFIFDHYTFKQTFSLLAKISLISFILSIPYISIYLRILSNLIGSSGVAINGITANYIWSLFQTQVYPWQFWLMIITFSITIFVLKGKQNKAILLIGSFLITYLVLPFFNQINYRPTRPFYYLMLMNFFFLSIFLKICFNILKNRNWKIILEFKWREDSHNLTTFAKVIILVFIVLTIMPLQINFVYKSVNELPNAIEYYYVLTDDYLNVLSWIKKNLSVNTSIITLSRGSYCMHSWVEALTERRAVEIAKTYSSGNRVGTLSRELEMSNMASSLLEGNYITENGNLRVVEVFPCLLPGTPKIAINRGVYQDVLAIDDSVADIYTFNSNSTYLFNMHFIRPENSKIDIISESSNSVNYLVTYEWKNLNFSRITMLERDSTVLHISYSITSTFVIKHITIPIYAWVNSYIISNETDKVSLMLIDKFGTAINTTITFINASEGSARKFDIKMNSDGTIYAIVLSLWSNSSFINFSLEMAFDIPKALTRTINHFYTPDEMRKNNFKYVLVDKNSDWFHDVRDWLDNSGYYHVIYRSGNIFLYEYNG